MKWIVFPSEKAAERARRELFAQSMEAVWLGETIFSLPHFLKNLAGSRKPIISRRVQKHLLLYCLKNHPLRHFEKLRRHPSLADTFLIAIRQLKREAIDPAQLEELLKESGSLKEYDLLKTYERYEALKKELGVSDEEDTYKSCVFPNNLKEIVFENFLEIPAALRPLLKKIKTTFSKNADVSPAQLKNCEIFSLPTPHQEIFWFLKKVQFPSQIGVVTGSNHRYYEPIWEKLKQAGVVEGESPFLNWLERAEGRKALQKALLLELKEATLKKWLECWLQEIAPGPFLEFAQPLLFGEHLLSLGTFSKREWLDWLQSALDEKPKEKISSSLEGVQWLDLGEGDFPKLDYLWVPGMIEGQFPSLTPSIFKIPSPGFEDGPTLFAKERRPFLKMLAQAKEAVWLTHPRLNSTGKDLAPSPLLWDFPPPKALPAQAPPIFFPQPRLEEKLRIEQERLQDTLRTGAYHAEIDRPAMGPLEVQKEDHIFSPTQLETYAQCPFKFFARRVLGIPQAKEYSPEVDPEDKGTLFHQSVEALLSKEGVLFQEALQDPAKEKIFYEKLEAVANEVFEKSKKEFGYAHPELYQRLKEKTIALAQQTLAKELEGARSLKAPMKATYFEWSFGTDAKPPLKMEGRVPLLLGGRIDRIDLDPAQKRFLILDYKTGSVEAVKAKLLEGLSLQLPVYMMAVQKLLLPAYQPAGGLLIAARTGEKKMGMVDRHWNETYFRLHKRSTALMELPEMKAMIEKTAAHIQGYVEKIRSGYFSAQPKDCRTTCDYKEICRYAHKPID